MNSVLNRRFSCPIHHACIFPNYLLPIVDPGQSNTDVMSSLSDDDDDAPPDAPPGGGGLIPNIPNLLARLILRTFASCQKSGKKRSLII